MKFISQLLLILSISNVQSFSRANKNSTDLKSYFSYYSMEVESSRSRWCNSDILTEIMVTMIKGCTLGTPTILFHEDPSSDAIKTLMTWKPVNVFLHSEFAANRADYRYNNVHPFDRIDVFALIVTNLRQFQKSLNLLKWIKSWDAGIPTFIVNQNDKSCANAINHFNMTRRLNLSAPYFICINSDNNGMIYTHSPYTSRAPYPWEIIEEFPELEGKVFKRIYNKEKICNNLYFDRTRNLANHSINVIKIYENAVIPNGVAEYYEKFENVIKSSLNTTFNNLKEIMINPSKLAKLLSKNTVDLIFKISQFPSYDKLRITYPVIYSNCYILIHPKSYSNPIDFIFIFHNFLTITLTIASWLILKAIFKMEKKLKNNNVSKQEMKSNCKNFFSFVSEDFPSLPTEFIIIMIFTLFWMIYGSFYGDLIKYCTHPQLKKSTEKFKDFEVNSCLAGSKESEDVVGDDKHVLNHYQRCVHNVINKTLAACIDDYIIALHAPFTKIPKYSTNSFRSYHFMMRHDWLLYRRVDEILMILEQAGISRVWYTKLISVTAKEEITKNKYSTNSKFNYKSININTLIVAFGALAVGLIGSIFCFILEIVVNNRNKRMELLDELMFGDIEDISIISCTIEELPSEFC